MGATFRQRGQHYLVTVHWQGQREYKTVKTLQDAKALVGLIHAQEAQGVNVIDSYRKARQATTPTTDFPTLEKGMTLWLDAQVARKEFRVSTGTAYRHALRRWLFDHKLSGQRRLGDVRVDKVTREQLGAALQAIRHAGKSRTMISHVHNPLKAFYQPLVKTKQLAASPAADLKFFVGKRQRQGKRATSTSRRRRAPCCWRLPRRTTRAGTPSC